MTRVETPICTFSTFSTSASYITGDTLVARNIVPAETRIPKPAALGTAAVQPPSMSSLEWAPTTRAAHGLGERSEQVRSHARDIADVVAHIIAMVAGLRGSSSGIFSHLVVAVIGADVGSLCVDATANTTEQCDARTAKTVVIAPGEHDSATSR